MADLLQANCSKTEVGRVWECTGFLGMEDLLQANFPKTEGRDRELGVYRSLSQP